MTTSSLEPLDLRIERAHRTALVRTVVLSVAVVAAAAAFLWFITNQAEQGAARLGDGLEIVAADRRSLAEAAHHHPGTGQKQHDAGHDLVANGLSVQFDEMADVERLARRHRPAI